MSEKDTVDTELTPEFVAKMNAAVFNSEMILSDNLYLDLALFRDLALGAVFALAFQEGPETARRVYTVVREHLPAYRERRFPDLEHYFPGLGYTNAQIQQALEDPAWSNRIFRMAPITEFFQVFSTNLAINVNHSGVMQKNKPIRIFINPYPLRPSRDWRLLTAAFFARTYGVVTTVETVDPRELTDRHIDKFDEFYTYFIKEFTNNPTIHKALGALRFQSKRIFAAPFVGDRFDPALTDEIVARDKLAIISTMNVATRQFTYIPMAKCSPPINGGNPLKTASSESPETDEE
jgi:hypothetical protein